VFCSKLISFKGEIWILGPIISRREDSGLTQMNLGSRFVWYHTDKTEQL
jgi:hypothetical protein